MYIQYTVPGFEPMTLFSIYFWSFQTNIITFFTTNTCEQMSIQYTVPGFDPRPLERESLPITTRSGLVVAAI